MKILCKYEEYDFVSKLKTVIFLHVLRKNVFKLSSLL